MVLLNGKLEVTVIEANDLPNLDHSFTNPNDKSDPYCVVECMGANGTRRIGKTFTIDDCLNPSWFYKIEASVNQDVKGLKFTVKDKDLVGSETIGYCYLDVQSFTSSGREFEGFLALTSPKKKKAAGTLKVQVGFTGSEGGVVSSSIPEKYRIRKDDLKERFSLHRSSTKDKADHVPPSSYFFHGVLEIFIERAEHLPNLDSSILSFKKSDVSDPYVAVFVIDEHKETWRVATTSVIDNNLNPAWRERFFINLCHSIKSVKFEIRDKDVVSSDEIGSVVFMAEDLTNPQGIRGGFDMYVARKLVKKSKLFLEMTFTSAKELAATPEVIACPHPMREGNWVTLYQDAHCVKLPSMQIFDVHGHPYQPRRAWFDLYHAIMNAREYIYIIGWSVNPKIRLLRWENEDDRRFGDILLQKANEGVHVCIMVWNELTSTDFNKDGAMSTSDEVLAEFFRDTSVNVILATRERKSKDFSTKERFTNFCYSHHQKSIIMDSETRGGRHREPMAFLGGLDISDGRFDTPEHHLFKTLHTDHRGDFHNNIFLAHPSFGPRQPWHDIHCCVQGPVAQDVLSNFRERWIKQGSLKRKPSTLKGEDLNPRNSLQFHGSWNVQMFRSINSDSATFSQPKGSIGLSIKKGRIYDSSIQRAYIHHIRRSKKFMYLENQYFMGSSHDWKDCRDTKISNLVPLEIALHIEDKIRSHEHYVAYILIPMFPEGKPADKVTQEMLHWQFRTMEMMYTRIARAIEETGVNAEPQDYLLFFCLGKKEGLNRHSPPEEITGHALKAFIHMRNMIYVHSKMAIFDDEYIIVGSANINDRSMSGNRDTEIAVGAYQPEHMMTEGRLPRGEVAMFRKSLWAEHMGIPVPLDQDPSSIPCARIVRQLAEEGLLTFLDQSDKKGMRHLLLYPLRVKRDGTLKTRDDCPKFPDTDASIIGKRSGLIPTRLTS